MPKLATSAPASSIRISGARTHNLKNVSLDIAHGELTVLTGVSGSGKSSLAFDTLYAEGQRQYIASLSTYARQFLNQLQRPDVDSIEGMQPTLCIDQRLGAANPRSTVATVTEIYDYLRLLMARVGTPGCPSCGQSIDQQSDQQIHRSLLSLAEGTRLVLLAPMVRGRKGAHRETLQAIRQAGLVKARIDNELVDMDAVPQLAVRQNHTIEAVVDKIIVRPGAEERLAESLQVALRLARGLVSVSYLLPEAIDPSGSWHEQLFSTRYSCPTCQISLAEIEPRTFSFNSPYGACQFCGGQGVESTASAAAELSTDLQAKRGLTSVCSHCHGARLRPEALAVRLHGRNIFQICTQSIAQSLTWIEQLQFAPDQQPVAQPILAEMLHRLRFLERVGVGYLTLARSADSLSGGELQRVRLATCIGSGLVGVCYILDEPSIGLHQRDNDRLIESLRDLQRQGNTVLVVEHDEAMMRQADFLVDMGPGAGRDGGEIVAAGTPDEVARHPHSLTAAYLNGAKQVVPDKPRRPFSSGPAIALQGANLHNLKHVDVVIPLGLLVGITGVSGSGKSSLIAHTLVPALTAATGQSTAPTGPYSQLSGVELIDKLIEISQAPIGRTPRSTPATYCGVFDLIRAVWANTRYAKQRGYNSGRFSFNSGSGRCPQCQGQGQEKIEMNFLPDLFVTCSACNGLRFNRQTLQVRYRDKSIADVLDMSISEAVVFFENFQKISRLLGCLEQVGLGYLQLGQSSITLSGGEAQRIKLATELARPATGRTVYFLDEPTTGLHFEDVRRLIGVLDSLVAQGNTVIVIEHNLDVIRACDWLIDLGPEGGPAGGEIVGTGTPEQLSQNRASLTGRYL